MKNNLNVCPACVHNHQFTAWERIESLFDEHTFKQWDEHLISNNPLDFPDYVQKLEKDREKTNLNEAIVTSKGSIDGYETAFGEMDVRIRMGSMESIVGEKIWKVIERANIE